MNRVSPEKVARLQHEINTANDYQLRQMVFKLLELANEEANKKNNLMSLLEASFKDRVSIYMKPELIEQEWQMYKVKNQLYNY